MFQGIPFAIIPFLSIVRNVCIFNAMDDFIQKVEFFIELLAEVFLDNENNNDVEQQMTHE